ncbi:MAG: alkaline phosphatase D family protein, partial [Acidimicrobiales bacterium]
MPSLERRDLLTGAGALVAARRLGVRLTVNAAPAAAGAPFLWGVASFDPAARSVLIWTRVAVPADGGPVRLRWVVAADEALSGEVASGGIEVSSDNDHCAVVDATGLEPGRTWWYAFTTDEGDRSPVGRTRTLSEGAADRLRLGVVSCSRYATAGFAAYRALADREVDAVVHLGDYIYEDGATGARAHEPAARLVTLDDYRARYAQHRTDPDLQMLHARHPMIAVWDDHEVAGNAWRDGATGHDTTVDGPWLDRLLAAGRAHEEWLPGRTRWGDTDGRLQAWRSLSFGALAELVVLDTRTWGRDEQPRTAPDVGGPPAGGAPGSSRSMLGEDQLAFVRRRLQPSDPSTRRPWVLLANQVMFHPLEVPVPFESLTAAIEDAGFLVVDGHGLNPDQWDGYPQAREELAAAMGGDGGVVVLTGDVHSSWAWEGPANDGGRPAMVELVTPSISSTSLADRLPLPAPSVEAALQGLSDDLSHVELSSHGYLVVDLDADRVQAEWWYVVPDVAGSQRFGAGRSAPREVPMHLTEVDQPLRDPVPTTGTTIVPTTARAAPSSANHEDSGVPLVLGAGAAAVTAAA